MKKYIKLFTILLAFLICSFSVDAKSNINSIKKDRLIITFKTNYNNKLKNNLEKKLGKKVIKTKKLNIIGKNSYVVYFKNNLDNYNNNFKSLSKEKYVKRVMPSYIYKLDKSNKKIQSKAIADYWHMSQSKADLMKNEITSNKKVRVGVLDTGIYYNHPDLKNKINNSLSYDFINNNKDASDVDGHGTHVSGLIGGHDDYATGQNVELVSYRVLSEYEESYTETIVPAIEKANKDKVQIINMSLGLYGDEALEMALSNYKGLIVAAAGNSNNSDLDYPAASKSDNILSVGAIDKSTNKASFSSYSKEDVDIFAPGSKIFSSCSITLDNCRINDVESDHDGSKMTSQMSGTSMASPIVAGIAASLMSEHPELSVSEIKNVILDSAIKNESLEGLSVTEGYIDAKKALEYAKNPKTNGTHKVKIVDGKALLWGNNENGQLGNGNNTDLIESNAYEFSLSNENIIKYYITTKNTFLITDQGNLYVSGSNDNNQLNQYNKSNTNVFVKFNKISNNHKIVGIDFRKYNGLYSENNLIVKLTNNDYYAIGKDTVSKELSAYNLPNKGLIYITKTSLNNYKTIQYYNDYSKTLKGTISYNYYYYEDSTTAYEFLYKISEKNYYNGYYTIKTNSYYGENDLEENLVKYNNKGVKQNYTKKYFSLEYSYNFNNNDTFLNLERLDKAIYKNGKVSYITEDYYNNAQELKSNKYGNAYRIYKKYSVNGKNTSHYKAKYDSKGKRGKYNLTYKKIISKKYVNVYKKSYSTNMVINKYTISKHSLGGKKIQYKELKYKGKYKNNYLIRSYKNNVKAKDIVYRYNKKGLLKSTAKDKAYKYIKTYKKGKLVSNYRYVYDSKGKLTSKKLVKGVK